MSQAKPPRHKRPVRFNRTRANPMQRLPFYRRSHAGGGDYWRMPPAEGYAIGREIGTLCAGAFLMAVVESLRGELYRHEANLAEFVASAIQVSGGVLSPSERGIIDGFFGTRSPLTEILHAGVRQKSDDLGWTKEQIEAALADASAMSPEEYLLQLAPQRKEIGKTGRDGIQFKLQPNSE